MELVLKTSGQQCLVGSNPTASAKSPKVFWLYSGMEKAVKSWGFLVDRVSSEGLKKRSREVAIVRNPI